MKQQFTLAGAFLLSLVGALTVCANALTAQEPQASAEVITNETVIQMVMAKLPKNLLLSKIQSAKNAFDITPDGLVGLCRSGVPSDVIETMMKASTLAQSHESLSNDGVVKMVLGRVPGSLIESKIRMARPAFDVTVDGVIGLHQNKIADGTIEVMMSASGRENKEALTNDGVIKMVANGLSRELIIAKIQSTKPAFDLTAAGLVVLTQNRVAEKTIAAMQAATVAPRSDSTARPVPGSLAGRGAPSNRGTGGNSTSSTRSSAVEAPKSPEASLGTSAETRNASIATGRPELMNVVYAVNPGTGSLSLLERQTAKVSGRAGFVTAKNKASVNGPQSPVRLMAGQLQEFVVQIAAGADPAKFKLYRFDAKSDKREVTLSTASGLTRTVQNGMGTVPFDISKVGDGLFKFIVPASTPAGEYGFTASDSQEVFCFALTGTT